MSQSQVDPKEFIRLEEELYELKKERGLVEDARWKRVGDRLVDRLDQEKVINRKHYIRLALFLGWFTGAHRFYRGQRFRASLYLLFSWTGIPFIMTLIDLLEILPQKADSQGNLLI